MTLPFSSKGKRVSREKILSLIHDLSNKAGRGISYLGLPSPWMVDIEQWRPYLSDIYAIEKKKEYLPHLLDRAYSLGVFEKTRYFWGDIDELLQKGTDNYDRNVDEVFPIDLFNLDYCRGLDYKQFKKISTIKIIMEKQRNSLTDGRNVPKQFPYFILCLTHNVPKNEGNPNAKRRYMKNLTKDVEKYNERLKRRISIARDWHLSNDCPPSYLHKCFVIGRLAEFAKNANFQAKVYEIIEYSGDKGALMLHYQFKISLTNNLDSPVPTPPKLGITEILNQSILNENGEDIAPNRPKI